MSCETSVKRVNLNGWIIYKAHYSISLGMYCRHSCGKQHIVSFLASQVHSQLTLATPLARRLLTLATVYPFSRMTHGAHLLSDMDWTGYGNGASLFSCWWELGGLGGQLALGSSRQQYRSQVGVTNSKCESSFPVSCVAIYGGLGMTGEQRLSYELRRH